MDTPKVHEHELAEKVEGGCLPAWQRIVLASQELQGEKLTYWLKMGLSTFGVWVARYVVLNFLIAAYVP